MCLIRSQIILVLVGGVESIVFGHFDLAALLLLPRLKCLSV